MTANDTVLLTLYMTAQTVLPTFSKYMTADYTVLPTFQ